MSHAIAYLAMAVAMVFGLGGAGVSAASSTPNIIFVLSDDQGFADVGYHGSVIDTPRIDSIAAAGVTLERYYTYPICGPTRVALMTGRNPIRLGLTSNIADGEDGVPLDEHMLPETFRAAGYQTWMMGKWHLGGSTGAQYMPQNRGFDYFYGFLGASIDESTHETPSTGALDWQRNGTSVVESGLATDLLTDEAIGLIEGRDKTRPFLLYVAFHAVHVPYDAPQALIDKYTNLGLTGNARDYAAMAENMDTNIGRLLDTLDAQGIANQTIVVFASDNGGDVSEGASNDPLRGGKNTPWEGGVRVPAALRWPGVLSAGAVSTQAVTVMDWLPTLAEAAGITPRNSKPLDGRDRWAAIRDGADGRPYGLVVRRANKRLVLDGDWKIVRETNVDPWQLYDVYDDPSESNDLAGTNPGIVSALEAFDTLIDMDADGDFVADDEDACTVVAGILPPADLIEQSPERLRLTLRKLDRGAGEQTVIANGYFNPAETTPAIDPSANGLHVRISDDTGEAWSASLPAGLVGTSPCDARDGWKILVRSKSSEWKYVNKSGGIPDGLGGCLAGGANGVIKAVVRNLTATSRQAWQFKVVAKKATVVVPAVPLQQIGLEVSLGASGGSSASPQAMAGECASFLVEGDPIPVSGEKPYCRVAPTAGSPKTIACKGP